MDALKERVLINDPARLTEQLVRFIRNAVEVSGRNGCVLGNSGGIDSALVAKLAVEALGKNQVSLLFLPERDTHKNSGVAAQVLADSLGMTMQVIDIAPILRKIGVYRLEPPARFVPRSIQEKYVEHQHETFSDGESTVFMKMLRGGEGNRELQRHMAYYSIKHRVRMSLLYHHAELENGMVLGTCNRSEKMTGLFIKYGDGACDLAPILGLYKTQVFQLARYLALPWEIIDKTPTGDLAPGLTDEGILKIDYTHLDLILAGFDAGVGEAEIASAVNVPEKTVRYVRELVDISAPMREPPLEPDWAAIFPQCHTHT